MFIRPTLLGDCIEKFGDFMEKIKILFLINTLGGGGAERVLVNLVNNMDLQKYEITVETMFSGGVNETLLKPEIHYICKNAFTMKGISHIYKFLPARYLYKKFIGNNHYDIIVGYMHNVPVKAISGCDDKLTKLIGWCHCGTVRKDTYCTCWFTKKGAEKSYKICDALAGVSDTVSNGVKDFFNITTPCVTVYNTNDVNMIHKMSEKPFELDNNVINICAVGRLSFEKGNDRLISAANRLLDEGYKINLYLLGAGKERENLQKLVQDNNNEKSIKFLGFRENPYPAIKNTDLFVCPSRVEGLSTVVIEALLLGKPIVSTDVSGAKEILGYNNDYGCVVENSTNGIYNGIKLFLDNENLFNYYGKKAKERSSFFEISQTVKQAENLFESVLSQ